MVTLYEGVFFQRCYSTDLHRAGLEVSDHLRNPFLSIQWDADDFTEEAMKEMLDLRYVTLATLELDVSMSLFYG